MRNNLKINGQQTVRVGTVVQKPPVIFMGVSIALNGGPLKVPGATNGRQI